MVLILVYFIFLAITIALVYVVKVTKFRFAPVILLILAGLFFVSMIPIHYWLRPKELEIGSDRLAAEAAGII